MKKIALAGLLLAALTATGASAQDWSGAYVTGSLGWAKDRTETYNPRTGVRMPVEADPQGRLAALGVGYNWQNGSLVYGIEADISSGFDGVGIDGVEPFPFKIDRFATIRGRIGYSFGAWLPYVTAGHFRASTTLTDVVFATSGKDTVGGWVGGVGLDYRVDANWSLRTEYLTAKFKSSNDLGGWSLTTENKVRILRIGASYRF